MAMGTLIHIAEVAGLLFAAYVVGWLIGYIAHRITASIPKPAFVAASRLAAAKGEAPPPDDALVKAPVVVPVSNAPPPAIPALATPLEPAKATAVPDGLAPAGAKAMAQAQPAEVAKPISGLDSLKTLSMSAPLMTPELVSAAAQPEVFVPPAVVEPTMAAAAAEPIAEPEPIAVGELVEPASQNEQVDILALEAAMSATAEPIAVAAALAEPEFAAAASPGLGTEAVAEAQPETEPSQPAPPAMPTTRPGVAWAGAIGGREAAPFDAAVAPIAEVPVAESAPAAVEPETVEVEAFNVEVLGLIADKLKQVEDLDQPVAGIPEIAWPASDEGPHPVEPAAADPAPMIAAEPITAPELPPESVVAPVPPPQPVHVDEDSAMRAIEGGWSRRASRALPDAPEMTDVSAAVSAAQVAVEQVLARNGVDAEPETRAQAAFGKPRGLPQPRLGGRDNLKQISGLGPLDESTLNNLGIYHFDQVSAWDQKEVLWLENHAFARGRIGREDWQAQARALMRGAEAARAGG